ncbi:hypothetical protein F5884DRAFT_817691 [Xylogone sp. PMI_703]|nr:hypothetical protein F5884DRAFT_817691 [Xylogone sp. PMI_703]
MSLPTPVVPLDHACSVLYNNTIYSYSNNAFQSLSLKAGQEWLQLPMGVAVEGGVCVKSNPQDSGAAALYIVGGTANSTQPDYPGIQRYLFEGGTWETITPNQLVTQSRLWHNAVYMKNSDSLLVYGGTQDGTMQPSSQTFVIQAHPPYSVLAFGSNAPPAINPVLIPWTDEDVMYCGGSTTNTQIFNFNPSAQWVDTGITLANPFYDTSAIKATVVDGDDGSRSLYTFDLTTSPNTVNRTVILGSGGQPIQNAQPVVSKRAMDFQMRGMRASKRNKRDLTVANWPSYNDTLAPTTARSDYSLATDDTGLVAMTGGNDKDPLCLFQAKENTWENATALLVLKSQIPLSNVVSTSKSSSSLTPTSTPTPKPSSTTSSQATTSAAATSTTSSPTATAVPSDKDPKLPVKILGIVLGCVVALSLFLLLISCWLRRLRAKQQHDDAGHQRRASGIPEKSGMDFVDRGLPIQSTTRIYANDRPTSQGSFSSMAILMGRVGHQRSSEKGGSDSSSQFNKTYKGPVSNPVPRGSAPLDKEIPMTRPRGNTNPQRESMRRSSGWNRYWSGGSALNILGFGAGSRRTTYGETDSSSHYTEQRAPSQYTQGTSATQPSAVVPPLKLAGGPELNTVAAGSPRITNSPYGFPLSKEMSGQIERSASVSSLSTFNEHDRADAYSSGVPASVRESWLPFQGSWHEKDGPRVVSNAYSESVYAASDARNSAAQAAQFMRESRFPTPPVAGGKSGRAQEVNSDMSWLNLGGDTKI